jgi:hypothetical protein
MSATSTFAKSESNDCTLVSLGRISQHFSQPPHGMITQFQIFGRIVVKTRAIKPPSTPAQSVILCHGLLGTSRVHCGAALYTVFSK